MANKHLPHDLAQMQSLPLEAKIIMSQQRARQWYDYWDGDVYVSFSGGIDSTVLKHIIDNTPGLSDVPSVFANTGLEYPEIQRFVRDIQAGKYPCFNSNVEIIRPKMRFDEIIKKYGYPVVSKEVARRVQYSKRAIERGIQDTYRDYMLLTGQYLDKNGEKSQFCCDKWEFLLDADFPVSSECCTVMKKRPFHTYEKETGRKPIIGTLAAESRLRYQKWLQHGCNAFNAKKQTSQPLAFWTRQDILHYIKKYNVPYCSVYGDIQTASKDGQLSMSDCLNEYDSADELMTTGCDRTGCIFCMFGCHLDKEPNRFQRLKQTHPKQYKYCIGGGEMVDGKWQPSKEGLGLGKVLDYIGVKYD